MTNDELRECQYWRYRVLALEDQLKGAWRERDETKATLEEYYDHLEEAFRERDEARELLREIRQEVYPVELYANLSGKKGYWQNRIDAVLGEGK